MPESSDGNIRVNLAVLPEAPFFYSFDKQGADMLGVSATELHFKEPYNEYL